MANWRDVMDARSSSDGLASKSEGCIQDDDVDDACAYALLAIKEELRALGTLIDFARGDAR